MAAIFKEVLGGKKCPFESQIKYKSPAKKKSSDMLHIPTPNEDLHPVSFYKNKVLLKGKKIPYVEEDDDAEEAPKKGKSDPKASPKAMPEKVAQELSGMITFDSIGFKGFDKYKCKKHQTKKNLRKFIEMCKGDFFGLLS